MPGDVWEQQAEQQKGWIQQGKEEHAKSILDYLLLNVSCSFDKGIGSLPLDILGDASGPGCHSDVQAHTNTMCM